MKRLLVMLTAVLCVTAASAIDRKTLAEYAKSLNGLKKEQLKAAIYRLSQAKQVPNYGSGTGGTWYYFYTTDRNPQTNECINRYSADRFYFPSTNSASAISGMNIEHSFPKSWWGGTKNKAYSDLFNLYPSESTANSAKGNYPMGKVDNPNILDDYEKVGTGNAGGKTIRLCEPHDTWKGDFCRSYFYMATTYQNLTWEEEGSSTQGGGLQTLENNDWPTLKEWAYTLYLDWARTDKVSQIEVDRNNAIYNIQDNRNLYVDFPTLAEYVWGDSTNVAFDPATALTTASDDSRYAEYTYTGSGDNTGGDNTGGGNTGGDNTGGDNTGGGSTGGDNTGDGNYNGEYLFYEPFDDVTNGNSTETGGSSSTWSGNSNFVTATATYQAGGVLRIGSSKNTGYIKSRTIGYQGGTLCVSLDIKGWTNVEGNLIVSLTGASSQVVKYSETISDAMKTHTLTFKNVSANPVLEIETSTKRAFIDNVRVWDPTATGISLPEHSAGTNVVYTISGQRVNGMPAAPGIYIINGRKVVVQ